MMKTGVRAFFCGRKSKFGYNMQAVCDADGRFLSVWINHPASASDFKKKTMNLLINVLSLHPTWMVDPDAALLREQLKRRQSGLKSCF
jgi:hypothetical protein